MNSDEEKPLFITILKVVVIVFLFIPAIIFAVLLLGTVGGSKQKGDFATEIFLRKPPSFVFPFLTEPVKRVEWQKGYVESVSLTKGEMKKGSRFVDIYLNGKDKEESEVAVIKYVDSKEYQFQIDNENYTINEKFVLENENENTKLIVSGKIIYKNSYHTLISPYLTYNFKKGIEKDLATLKALMEK